MLVHTNIMLAGARSSTSSLSSGSKSLIFASYIVILQVESPTAKQGCLTRVAPLFPRIRSLYLKRVKSSRRFALPSFPSRHAQHLSQPLVFVVVVPVVRSCSRQKFSTRFYSSPTKASTRPLRPLFFSWTFRRAGARTPVPAYSRFLDRSFFQNFTWPLVTQHLEKVATLRAQSFRSTPLDASPNLRWRRRSRYAFSWTGFAFFFLRFCNNP